MEDHTESPRCVIGTNSWGSRAYEKAVRGSYVDDSVIEEAVDAALAAGLTVFDTAEDYGFGYAQKLLGRLRQGRTFQISAKFTPAGRYKEGQVHKAFEKDCRDLQTDFVDYYWLHLPNDIRENLSEIIDLYKEGRIGKIGISNFNLQEAVLARDFLRSGGADLYGVQNHFSLLDREEEESGMLDWCRKNQVSFWGWAVLEEGVLAGSAKGPDSFMGLLFRKKTEKIQPLLQEMKKIGEHHGISVPQTAIAFCAAKGVVPICGCRKPYQTQQLAQAAGTALEEEEIRRLETMADQINVKILKSDIFRFAVHKA